VAPQLTRISLDGATVFVRSSALVLLCVLGASGRSAQFPVYDARHLQTIRWPADSPRPEEHSGDYTYAVAVVAGRPIGILRGAVGWGTGIIDESFTVLRHHREWTLDSLRDRPLARDRVWEALSFHNEAADAATGDQTRGHFSVGACLFIADDSLLAYGVFPDTSAAARAFIARERAANQAGYYRLAEDGKHLIKVAALASTFETRCRERLEIEGRGLTGS